VYIDEGDVCTLTQLGSGEVVYHIEPIVGDIDEAVPSTPKLMQVHHIELSLEMIEKGGYKHCM
jgi:hypothetical protein